MKLEWEIAGRYLKSKRKESFIAFISWFSLIGIALGVATLIIVMSVMNGFRKEIINNLIGTNGHLYISGAKNQVMDFKAKIADLEKIDDIIYLAPSIVMQSLLSHRGGTAGVVVSGITFYDLTKRDILYKSLGGYNLSSFQKGQDVVIIGRVLARDLNIKIGDNITLATSEGYTTIFGTLPKFSGFKVIGILNTGMYQYDSSSVIVPFEAAQKFFGYSVDTTQKIEIFISDPNNSYDIAKKIYLLNPALQQVQTWQNENKYLINAIDVEKNVMFLILSLIILIATFNIVSGLIMLVRSKTKEIAIFRTIGLSKKSIITIFMMIGIRIGIMGTFSGALIGVLFSANIEKIRALIEAFSGVNLFAEEVYFLSKLPADVQSFQVVLVILVALSFSILSSIYPAIRSAKIKPIEGLKYD